MELNNSDSKSLEISVDGHDINIKTKKDGNFEIDTEDGDLDDFVEDCQKYLKAHPRKLEELLKHIKEVWRKYIPEEDKEDGDDDGDDDGDEEDELSSIEIQKPISKEDQVDRKQFIYPSIATPVATQRLIADFVLMRDSNFNELGFKAAPKNSNLYVWEVKMIPPEETELYKDFQKVKKKGTEWIELEVLFPSTWPNEPPFVRVIAPRFVFRTGHVTMGGSICMDLLTMSGWKPIYTLDQILLQIRTEMAHGGGRLEIGNNQAYNIEEAKQNFIRVAQQHNWNVPNMNNLPWK